MFELTTILSFFKYMGIVLASTSTIWGLTHELYTKDDEGKRHLTRAGRYSIGFVVLGLLISLNTTVLESLNKQRADDRAQSEKQRQTLERLAELQRQESFNQEQREETRKQEARDLALAQEARDNAKKQKEAILDAEQRASIEGAMREQRTTRGELERHIGVITELSRVLQPIDDIKLNYVMLIPNDAVLGNYLSRIKKDMTPRIKFSQSTYFRLPFIDPQGDCVAEEAITDFDSVVILFFKEPQSELALRDAEATFYRKGDLSLDVKASEMQLEYNRDSQRVGITFEGGVNIKQAEALTSRIVSIPDLYGAQMIVAVAERAECGGLEYSAVFEMDRFSIRFGNTILVINKKEFDTVVTKEGVELFVFNFPEFEEFQKLKWRGLKKT